MVKQCVSCEYYRTEVLLSNPPIPNDTCALDNHKINDPLLNLCDKYKPSYCYKKVLEEIEKDIKPL